MRNITLWFITACLLGGCSHSTTFQRVLPPIQYNWACEIEQLRRIDELPLYRPGIVEEVSSYDTTGGNQDGFSGRYSYIRKEGDKLVIADLKGPGVIERIWTATPTNDTLEFYFDGEQAPRLRICFADLFSGKVYPFVHPLCGNQLGGCYCYVPIPYKQSCRILFCGPKMMFEQIEYRNLNGYPNLKSYRANLTAREKRALASVCKIWNDTIPSHTKYAMGKSADTQLTEKHITLHPGDVATFFEQSNGGRIAGFEIDGGKAFEGTTKDVLLEAVWDDASHPAIRVSIADFFGYAFGKQSMQSMLLGCRNGVNYCYLPAPFDRHATMKLLYVKSDGTYQPPIHITTRVWANNQIRNDYTEGRLYTCWRQEFPKRGEFYRFLSHKGRGHYVGTILLAQGFWSANTAFLEGDDSTYVDGKMRIHGTGTEDYFNGGWYAMPGRWDRRKSLPIHGALDYSLPLSHTGGYRFFLSDKFSFEQDFYTGIEHGETDNDYPVVYTSVAFYYADAL
ncbi:MAG: DUF2961 domain-containing protein [Mediterranea sp.]|jgi:hypothetical protein|nr:DUF2961 domain-containing protein [Mediterranea sp.]